MLTREQKEQQVANLIKDLREVHALLFINFQGLQANEIADLRKKLGQSSDSFKVVKNTLLQIALKNVNLEIPDSFFNQPIAIIFSADELGTSKALYQFAKEHEKLKILGGIVSGRFETAQNLQNFALLPSREELNAKLVMMLVNLIYRFQYVLKANLYNLCNILRQLMEVK